MATQEKLLKSLESIKNLANSNLTSDTATRKKEKIHHCNVVTEAISNPTIKIAPTFNQLLSFTIEVFLQLCDDPESDVRMVADECLNRIIRAMSTSNVNKIEIELHKEIKKNGAARSLRAALWRFAQLAHYIRPLKGKLYVINLVPSLVKITERNEELVHETLANSLPKIMSSLGCFTSDNDIKTLLKALFSNVAHNSPSIRRSTASCILTICLNCRKPYVFITYALNNILDLCVPVADTHSSNLILGVMGCLRLILPHVNNTDKDQEIQGSFGVRKETNEAPLAVDRLLQVYELCLHYMSHSDHNVINSALETMNILLQNLSAQLKNSLLNANGINRSRISYYDSSLKYKTRSPSVLSVATNPTSGDDSLALESELTDSVRSDIEKWISESKLSVGNVTFANTKDLQRAESLNSVVELQSPNHDFGVTLGSARENMGGDKVDSVAENLDRLILSETSSEKSCSRDVDLKASPGADVFRKDIDIGDFKDKNTPLIYCFRFIAKNFLLAGYPNSTIPDKITRVSVKSLALSCLSSIISLHPHIFLQYLDKNASKNSTDSQQISDLLLYENHGDPQLRGNVMILVASFVKAVCLDSFGKYDVWVRENCGVENLDVFRVDGMVNLLIKGLEDESSNCTRQTLIALNICLESLLESESSIASIPLLKAVPLVAKNPYWLVKVKLVEVLSEFPYVTIQHIIGSCDFRNKALHRVLFDLLHDDDQRVRNACACAIVKIIPHLYFEQYSVNNTTVAAKAAHYKDLYLSNLSYENESVHLIKKNFMANMPAPFKEIGKSSCKKTEYSLSIVLVKLKNSLLTSTSKHYLYGVIETLQLLSENYPTTSYPKAWSCFREIKIPKHIVRRNSTANTNVAAKDDSISSAADLFSLCVSLLCNSTIGYDLTCQNHLLRLTGNLFAGLAVQTLKPVEITPEDAPSLWEMFSDKHFAHLSESFLNHVVKLLNVFHHVLDELAPALPQNKPVLGGLPTASSLSPIKRKKSDLDKSKIISPGKLTEKDEKTERMKEIAKANAMGYFCNLPHYMKIYETLRTAYTNYKITLDTDASDKFLHLLDAALTALAQILEIGTLREFGRIAEEVLNYLRSCFHLQPTHSVECVQQLLKSLFGTNLTVNMSEYVPEAVDSEDHTDIAENSFHSIVYQLPYYDLGKCLAALHNINKIECDGDATIMGYLHRRESKTSTTLPKGSDKILASYIRMFEPMVIKSLEQYTLTSNVNLQCRVLQLISQLVQLKVNYRLLDAEQVFINFVLKQFEYIEKGQIHFPQKLIPKIFHFLVQLSYSKQQSKSIITVPKIINLCDGLMASGQSPKTHCIPALEPIVEDIFLMRNKSNTPNFQELETTREVVLSMLLRLSEYKEVVELLILIVEDSKFCTDNTEKWLRWSKSVVDVFLPMLKSNRIRLDDVEMFRVVRRLFFVLNPEVFRPINDVLVMVFQDLPSEEDSLTTINRWFSKIVLLFLPIIQVKEEILLGKILETQEEFSPGSIFPGVKSNSDPLNVSNSTNFLERLAPEVIFVKYIFRIVEFVAEKCVILAKEQQDDYLVEIFSMFLMLLLHIFESGSHCKIANVAADLVIEENPQISLENTNNSFLKLTSIFPTLVFEWCNFLTLLSYNNRKFWSSVMQITETYGILEQMKEKCEPKTHCVNSEVARILSTIAFCDYLSDNMADGEQMSWMLVNNVELLVNLYDEPPVFELISAVHRNSTASRLFIQAIATTCRQISNSSFKSKCLKAVENVHPAQIGPLLNFLLPDFLNTSQTSLSRSAASLASRKIELLLTMSMDEVIAQLPKEDLVKILDTLVAQKLAKKHETLVSLLNKLATYFYDHSPVELDQRRTVNPEYIKKLTINKSWYLSQVKSRCRTACSSGVAASLLANLEYDELLGITRERDFDKMVLKECILWGVREIRMKRLEEEPPLLKAAICCLLKEVAHARSLFPKPHQVYRVTGRQPTTSETKYTHKSTEIFSDETFFAFFQSLIPSVAAYISHLPHYPTIKIPETSFEDLVKFAVLALECLAHTIASSCENHARDILSPPVNFIDSALNCANAIFKEPHLCSILALDTHISWLCSAINSIYLLVEYLLLKEEPLPLLSKSHLRATLGDPETASAGGACHQLAALGAWLARTRRSEGVPDFLMRSIRGAVVSLARLPAVNSYALTPPVAWKGGWTPELGGSFNTQVPLLPIDFLQEIDVLEEYICRISMLGWTSRQQFEETWMCLLSVLCYSPPQDGSPDEINMVVQATSLSVQAITSLLFQTLYYPVPGNTNVSRLLMVPRNREIADNSTSLKKLKIVQNMLMCKLNECSVTSASSSKHVQNVFDCKNLENPSDKYGYGNFSVEYLSLASKSVENVDEKSLAHVVFKKRERMLEESGLDINSCLQFLLDLYSQWINDEDTTPLRILYESVRSLIIISDLFTERSQFVWMLDTLLELSKKHTIEDEILHQYIVVGVCKSAAVVSPDTETFETIKKMLLQYTKSAFLPSRIASLHGLLYLIQGCLLSNTVIAGISEELQIILPIAVEYVQCNLNASQSAPAQTQEHTILVWSLAFFLLENIDESHLGANFTTAILQGALTQIAQANTTSNAIHGAILKGLERIMIIRKDFWTKLDKQILNLAMDKIKNPNPKIAIPGLQLLLSYMYTECWEHLENISQSPEVVQSNPDHLVQTIEKISAIFDRIRKGHAFEVEIICSVLPNVLNDFFSPSDVLTKVIGEFLSGQQPHPKLLSGVVFQVFESTIKQSQLSLLQDWVVFSLSNFTQSLSIGMATWYLTCFFISASANEQLRAYFPHVQSRVGRLEYEDRKMLCVAGADFYRNLTAQAQRETFVKNFNSIRDHQGDVLFGDLLASL